MSRWRWAPLVIAALLVGCEGQPSDAEIVLPTLREAPAFDHTDLVGGRLFLRDGCVMLKVDAPRPPKVGRRLLVIWPPEATVEREERSVTIYDGLGSTAKLGDEVLVMGELLAEPDRVSEVTGAMIPSACQLDGYWTASAGLISRAERQV